MYSEHCTNPAKFVLLQMLIILSIKTVYKDATKYSKHITLHLFVLQNIFNASGYLGKKHLLNALDMCVK